MARLKPEVKVELEFLGKHYERKRRIKMIVLACVVSTINNNTGTEIKR